MGENEPFPSEGLHGLCPLWPAGWGLGGAPYPAVRERQARGYTSHLSRLLHVFLESLMLSVTLSCLPLNPLLMGMTSGCTALPCAWLHMGKCWTALWPGALGAGGQLSL